MNVCFIAYVELGEAESLEEAYARFYEGMHKSGLCWHLSDEWLNNGEAGNASELHEAMIQVLGKMVYGGGAEVITVMPDKEK